MNKVLDGFCTSSHPAFGHERRSVKRASEFVPASASDFDVVILYDTTESFQRAMLILDGISHVYSKHVDVFQDSVRLDLLNHPVGRKNARKLMNSAELLVVSTSDHVQISQDVKDWISEVASQANNGLAILQIGRPASEPFFLADIASATGTDFYAEN